MDDDLCWLCKQQVHGLDSLDGKPDSKVLAKDFGADSSCPFCALVRKAAAVIQSEASNADNIADVVFELSWDSPDIVIKPTYRSEGQSGDSSRYQLSANGDVGIPPVFDGIRRGYNYPADTGSDQTVSWVKGELQKCLSEHVHCSSITDKPLPTRVLDLGAPKMETGPDADVRLYETGGIVSPYLCLSHCWGSSQPLRTTKSTLESHKSGISWSKLPKNFQHAISFTRRLGFQYIWIDSLCIIQNDDEDWVREAARMYSIYQNATLVIAASIASGADDGFFSSDPSLAWRKEFSHSVNDKPLQFSLRNGRTRTDLSSLPISKRAWTFQEHVLPQRVLHFLPAQVLWQCRKTVSGEFGDPVSGFLSHSSSDSWWSIVEEYSTRRLTFAKDKLPAIAGLAKLIHEADPGRGKYLAGLWEKTLLSDLCWTAKTWKPKPEVWRASSWSWVSVDSPVRGFNHCNPEYVKVLEAKCVPKGDAYGELLSGHIVLSSVFELLPVRLRRMKASEKDISGFPEYFDAGALDEESWVSVKMDYHWKKTPQWVDLGSGHLVHEEKFFLLYLTGSKEHRWTCILLKATAEQGNIFERVGYKKHVHGRDPASFAPRLGETLVKIT